MHEVNIFGFTLAEKLTTDNFLCQESLIFPHQVQANHQK